MGVVIVGAIALYLIVSLVVVVLAARAAKKRGRSQWRLGGAAALVMYLLVFWDQIPTLVAHNYYCGKQAGFWVYKSLDQWKAENPGVAETLDTRLEPKLHDPRIGNRSWSTQRFYTDISRIPAFHAIGRTEEVFTDAVTRQPLARSINFFRGRSFGVFSSGGSLDDFRQALVFGWGNRECDKPSPTDQMRAFRYQFHGVNGVRSTFRRPAR